MTYQIFSDSSCDLPKEIVEKNRIEVVPFYVSFDGENYQKEEEEIKIRDFYQRMVDNPKVYPKSSLPSITDYYNRFLPYVEKGIPIICICITTKFSGSMQSAMTARDMIMEDHKTATITVMDATVNTVLQGLFVLEAAKMQQAGISYEDNIKRLEEIKGTGRIFFTVGDMEYLKHGGRIGKLTGIAATVLGIRPLITLKEGEIFPSGITRSRKKSMTKVIDMLLEYIQETGKGIDDFSLCVGFGYDYEEAIQFRIYALEVLNDRLKPQNAYTESLLPIYQIGATIGVHTGPYPIGFGIVEKAKG